MFLSPVIGIFQILFLPLSIIPVRYIHSKLESLVNNVLEKNAKNNQLKADMFKNIDYIKSNNLETFYINQIKKNNDGIVSVWGSVASMESLAGVWINGFMTSIYRTIIWHRCFTYDVHNKTYSRNDYFCCKLL